MSRLQRSAHRPAWQAALFAIEWPTVALAGLIYGGWLFVTFFHSSIPLPLRLGAGAWLIAWHGSLQHETIHGHPTPWPRLNAALGTWPLALWLPYALYRRSHLQHHATEDLTLPGADPESRYRPHRAPPRRAFGTWFEYVHATLLGRLLIGPALVVGALTVDEGRALAAGLPGRARLWAAHLLLATIILGWVVGVCRMSVAEYVLVFVYPGTALTLLRSFAEHRASPDPAKRIAVVERAPVLGLLFLNNNLHALHHQSPALPWYRLPATYRRVRTRVLEASGGLVYAGYGEIVRRYLLRPHDTLIHPQLDGGGR